MIRPSREKRSPSSIRQRTMSRMSSEFGTDDPPPAPLPPVVPLQVKVLMCSVLLLIGIWSFAPTVSRLAHTWYNVADYTHGFLVLPLALFFLWARRDTRPNLDSTAPVAAVLFLLASVLTRLAGDAFFLTFMDGWSIIPWAAAMVALLGGWPLLRWSWPSIAFLIFMVPLPFAIEHDLSGPLQRIATVISTTVLQFLGQPAFAEGNIILIGEERLEVAQACSGLRLFMGVIALTYAYVVIVRRPWWEKLILVLAAVPVAIVSNSARIVATGLLFQLTTDAQIHEWIHEGAGLAMIGLAWLMFWVLLSYLRWLFVEEDVMDISAVVKNFKV
ncbi:MAG: exosortase/archaeosortase family protein [Pirellulaceae bacterium]